MAIIKCPECGHQVSDQAKTCPSCGIEISGKVMRCPECGDVVFNNQEICPNCHRPLHKAEVRPDVKEGVSDPDTAAGTGASKEVPAEAHRKPGAKKSYIVIIVAFVIALLAVFVCLYLYKTTQDKNELDAYENAMTSNEPAVLQNYLDMYADAPLAHRDSITARLELHKQVDTEWTNAVVSGSKAALERYIQLHPSSIHVTEARIMIDSLDWLAATSANTTEAYQTYIDSHLDNGLHIDEARSKFDKLDALKVTEEERKMISRLFDSYFTALANNDENGLTETLSSIMTSFLHKENATKVDVMNYMKKLHAPEDITGMSFQLNNDWNIEKNETDGGKYEYKVTFSADHRISRNDTSKETFCTYNVEAKVSPDGKISYFNMKKLVP